jgi:mono/diheme cytochrome c family protein
MRVTARAAAACGAVLCIAFIRAEAAEGTDLYARNCMMCHEAGGTGLPGQFPRLAGRVSVLAQRSEGRNYLIDVVSYGLSTSIVVEGQSIFGVMPQFKTLSEDDVASVLSYVAALGSNPSQRSKRFTAAEVKARRVLEASDAPDVTEERKHLEGEGVIPQ